MRFTKYAYAVVPAGFVTEAWSTAGTTCKYVVGVGEGVGSEDGAGEVGTGVGAGTGIAVGAGVGTALGADEMLHEPQKYVGLTSVSHMPSGISKP